MNLQILHLNKDLPYAFKKAKFEECVKIENALLLIKLKLTKLILMMGKQQFFFFKEFV